MHCLTTRLALAGALCSGALLIACSGSPTEPRRSLPTQRARALPAQPTFIIVPSLPVPEDVTQVGDAVRRPGSLPGFLVTLRWKDTAVGEFITCFKFEPVSKQADDTTQCAYASDYEENAEGTDTRTAALPVTRGVYSVTAYIVYNVPGGPHPRSVSSTPITVEVR